MSDEHPTRGGLLWGLAAYFWWGMLPLFNVLFGVAFFKEGLRPAQGVAVVLAAAGVAYLIVALGKLPWIALTLGVSFSIYGVLRKITPVDGLLGLFVETVFLMPPSA